MSPYTCLSSRWTRILPQTKGISKEAGSDLSVRPVCEWICIITRNTCAKGNESDGIDRVLEVDKAAQVAGNVTDDGREDANGSDGG